MPDTSQDRISWPTLLQDSSIFQTLRRLDDATIVVHGTDVRRGESAARWCGVPRFLVLPGTGLICVCWWLVVQLLQEERVAGSLSLWLGPRAQGQEFEVTAHA
jgi:hypothetical protein